MRRYLAITGLLGLAVATFVAVTTLAFSAPADVAEKRAEAERVLAEIQDLDGRLGLAIENYNGADLRLTDIDERLVATGERLDIARKSSRVAQTQLAGRLRALYMGSEASSLEVMLGAASVDDLMDRMTTVRHVSARDTDLVEMARGARQETGQREQKLQGARDNQEVVVADRDQKRQDIEGLLAERERLAASIEGELAVLIEEETARQARLKIDAERRLVAQRDERERARSAAKSASAASNNEQAPASQSAPASTSASPAPAPAPTPVPPPPPSKYTGVVGTAMTLLGIPYVWGGSSPSGGFDCSGFVMYVYAQHGVSLPHHAATQYNYGTPVSRGALQPGDIVYFNGLGHNGIYIGNSQFIHSPHTGDVVKISSLNDSWYAATFVGARRL
jgi:cell wall-associated NlpC family hydrolase